MIDVDSIRRAVISGLQEYLGVRIVRTNQTGEQPAYPYLSYTITTLVAENKGTWGQYEDGVDRKPVTQTWSITVQSDNYAEAMELAVKAHEWLDHYGTVYLNDRGVIVQSVGTITSRDNLLTVEYEYRNGFDVVFWTLNEADNTAEASGHIETVEIGDDQMQPVTEQTLIEKLEKRLDGDV